MCTTNSSRISCGTPKRVDHFLQTELKQRVHEFLLLRARATRGLYIHGVGGTENHVHMAINYEPQLCVSEVVKELKGACSYTINQEGHGQILAWQRGYGAVSFGKRNLEFVLEYIANQKEHHQTQPHKIYRRLVRITADDQAGAGEYPPPVEMVREVPAGYDCCPI